MTGHSGHTPWCARDHRCNLFEHRSEDIIVDLPHLGRAVLTRVRGADGRDMAEIRARIALSPAEVTARRQLWTLLTGLRRLLHRTATAHHTAPRRAA